MKITLIIGLPGSGKSFLAKTMSNAFIIDDPIELDWNSFQEHTIICDINLCDPDIRANAHSLIMTKFPDVVIEEIYFENNPEQCRKNVEFRNDGRNVEGSIVRFTKVYTIPTDAIVLKVYGD